MVLASQYPITNAKINNGDDKSRGGLWYLGGNAPK